MTFDLVAAPAGSALIKPHTINNRNLETQGMAVWAWNDWWVTIAVFSTIRRGRIGFSEINKGYLDYSGA